MSDSYGIVTSDPWAPGGPYYDPNAVQVEVPRISVPDSAEQPRPGPLRVTVAPTREEAEAAQRDVQARIDAARRGPTTTGAASSWLDNAPDWSPPAAAPVAPPPVQGGRSWLDGTPDWTPGDSGTDYAAPPIGRTETALRAAAHGVTFGAEPYLEGAWEGGFPYLRDEAERAIGINPVGVSGLVTGDRLTDAGKRVMVARREAEQRYEQGFREHPGVAWPAEIAGSVVPMLVPGAGAAMGAGRLAEGAALGTRLARGAVAGGLQGAAYGVGSGLSEDRIQDAGDLIREGVGGGIGGAIVGSALHGAIGRRLPAGTPGAGAAAARTAEQLGAPLPRGVASDSPLIHNVTAAVTSVPGVGHLIPERVLETQRAAGNRILDIASQGTGVAPTRTGTGAMLRGAVQSVIDRNNAATDAAYANLRA